MTLVLNRVDDRLIHGQVVVGWGQPFDIGFIVLVNDEVAESDWEQELYRMGTPPEMDLYFHAVSAAVPALPTYREDSRNGILLTGDVASMCRLVKEGGVRDVNIGGIHHRPDRRQRLRYVFLSPVEEEVLKDMEREGATVSARDVPAASAVDLKTLLTANEAAR